MAPWMDRMQRAPALKGGLAAVTAAVVGVIANLGVWFALHVLFARVFRVAEGPLRINVPDLATFDWRAALLAIGALVVVFRFNWSIPRTLLAAALGGMLLSGTVF